MTSNDYSHQLDHLAGALLIIPAIVLVVVVAGVCLAILLRDWKG